MKKIIFIIMVLMISSSIAIADDKFRVNGQEWNSWDKGSRIYFLSGWARCGMSANNNLMINLSRDSGDAKLQHDVYVREGVIISGVSIGQLRLTLDSIYSDTRLTYIDIEEVMPLAVGRLNGGWTLEQLDKVISYIVRINKCEYREKELGKIIDECSDTRKERNEYMRKLGH